MTEYTYTSISTSPSLPNINYSVSISEMTNKDIGVCGWEETAEELKINFAIALSGGDKTILDEIVASPTTKPTEDDGTTKERNVLLRDSEGSSSSGVGTYPSFSDRLAVAGDVCIKDGAETLISAKLCIAYALKSDNNSDTVYCKPKITINGNSTYGTERNTDSNSKTTYYEEIDLSLDDIVNSNITVAISCAITDGGGDYTGYLDRAYIKILYE